MNLPNKTASSLIGKDKIKARQSAENILNIPDIEAWQCLIENSEFLFSHIKEKAGINIINSANKANIENIFSLLKYHSSDWDSYIAEILAKFSDDEIETRMLDILINASEPEKAYAAKYFSLIISEKASIALFNSSKSTYQPLKSNSAEALGKLKDNLSYDFNLIKLKSADDWDKVEASEFLAAYGNEEAVYPMLEAMSSSAMSEHISGYIAMLKNYSDIFNDEDNYNLLALEGFDNLISGLVEVWPLNVLFDFKIYETLENLIILANKEANNLSGKYAQLLIKAKLRISLYFENSQYTFDEERPVINELEEIYHLLNSEDNEFWERQINYLYCELEVSDEKRNIAAITLLNELNLKESIPFLIKFISNNYISDLSACEAIITLSKLGVSEQINEYNSILSRIKDKNIASIIQNSLIKKG